MKKQDWKKVIHKTSVIYLDKMNKFDQSLIKEHDVKGITSLQPTIYPTRGNHVNNYTTDMVALY
jgi:hypothetical protein